MSKHALASGELRPCLQASGESRFHFSLRFIVESIVQVQACDSQPFLFASFQARFSFVGYIGWEKESPEDVSLPIQSVTQYNNTSAAHPSILQPLTACRGFCGDSLLFCCCPLKRCSQRLEVITFRSSTRDDGSRVQLAATSSRLLVFSASLVVSGAASGVCTSTFELSSTSSNSWEVSCSNDETLMTKCDPSLLASISIGKFTAVKIAPRAAAQPEQLHVPDTFGRIGELQSTFVAKLEVLDRCGCEDC